MTLNFSFEAGICVSKCSSESILGFFLILNKNIFQLNKRHQPTEEWDEEKAEEKQEASVTRVGSRELLQNMQRSQLRSKKHKTHFFLFKSFVYLLKMLYIFTRHVYDDIS